MSTDYKRQLNYLDLIIRNNKVPHAFLFYGNNISSMFDLARMCSFRINNKDSKWEDFNLDNEIAEKIKNESHPDFFVVRRIDGKKDISVLQMSNLRNFISKTPISFVYKSVIIENAEFLNEESWNSILKTLEEPSGNTVIFLLCTRISLIPKTILSRVVSIPFYDQSDSWRKFNDQNSIIVSKLSNVKNMTISERFDLAEKIANSDSAAVILDEWLLDIRFRLLSKNEYDNFDSVEKIAGAKSVLVSTNANARLVLENLLLQIN